jgi:hypothetical protein
MRPFVAFANQVLVDIAIKNVKDMYITIILFFQKSKFNISCTLYSNENMILHSWMFSKFYKWIINEHKNFPSNMKENKFEFHY